MQCVRCNNEADREVTWPFNGVTEPYCADCMDEYHRGADEIDAHESRIAAEGCAYTSCCPRPTERAISKPVQ